MRKRLGAPIASSAYAEADLTRGACGSGKVDVTPEQEQWLDLLLSSQEPSYHPEVYLLPRAPQKEALAELNALIQAGELTQASHLYQAAQVLMGSDEPMDLWQAHLLASHAGVQGHAPARFLAACAVDRWLMVQLYPQKYGTQCASDGVRLRLYDIDKQTSDEERAQWNVPAVSEQKGRLEQLNTQFAAWIQRDVQAVAPVWLRTMRKRWERSQSR